MYFTQKCSPISEKSFSILTALGNLAMADWEIIYLSGICTSARIALFAL